MYWVVFLCAFDVLICRLLYLYVSYAPAELLFALMDNKVLNLDECNLNIYIIWYKDHMLGVSLRSCMQQLLGFPVK